VRCVRNLATAFLVIAVSALHASVTLAQPASPEPGRVEVSAGSLWIGRQVLGSTSANETTGAGGTFALFQASTELASLSGLEGRVGVRVWRGVEAELEASYGKPQLKISIGNDTENAAQVTAVETIQQITVGAGVVWSVPYRPWRGRLMPFVTAAAGYLRAVHEAQTLIEAGRYYQVGGGVKVLLVSRSRSFFKGLGVRADARAMMRSKGVSFDAAGHASPAIGASVFLRF
jgi:hypothetical protein